MLIIKSKHCEFGVSFPTSVEDITPEILKSVTDHVKLPKHYCVIGMCFRTSLFEFVTTVSKSKGADIPVVNILAKADSEDIVKYNWNIGDRLIVDRSSIERGHHLSIPIAINSVNAATYLNNDEELRKSIVNGSYLKERGIKKGNDIIYLLEFKIVPLNDIVAAIPRETKGQDPFKVVFND